MRVVRLRSAVQLLWFEGAFALAYETWFGPTYLTGLAGELAIPVAHLSFLAAAPWIGAVGQVLGLLLFARFQSVRRYTLVLASLARALWLLPLVMAYFWFPSAKWFSLLAATSMCSALLATSSSAAWQSWVAGIVPRGMVGRFFGTRQAYVMSALIASHLLAMFWVGWKPGGSFAGYGVLALLALSAALTSTLLLARVPDVKTRPEIVPIREAWSNVRFRRLVIFGAAFNGAVQLAGPYFPFYFTHDVHIPMSVVAMWTVLTNLGYLVAARYWGRKIDLSSSLKPILGVTGFVILASPLVYVINVREILVWIGPIEYFFNGLAWSGFQIGLFALLFRSVPGERNLTYFTVYAAASGLAGAIGSLLGGSLAHLLAAFGGFRALWVIGAILRALVLMTLLPLLQEEASECRDERHSVPAHSGA